MWPKKHKITHWRKKFCIIHSRKNKKKIKNSTTTTNCRKFAHLFRSFALKVAEIWVCGSTATYTKNLKNEKFRESATATFCSYSTLILTNVNSLIFFGEMMPSCDNLANYNMMVSAVPWFILFLLMLHKKSTLWVENAGKGVWLITGLGHAYICDISSY